MAYSRTENGALTLASSGNPHLDLFFNLGAARSNPGKIAELWQAAFRAGPELAVRIALWGRDVRGGAGERAVFREILTQLDGVLTMDDRLFHAIAQVGRADDLFVITRNFGAMASYYKYMIDNSELAGLFAKWAPRQGALANSLRKAWGFATPKQYRKFVVRNSATVEQLMCSQRWYKIDYKTVPSVAAARYNAAFMRNDENRYVEYREALKSGDTKINASAIFPHDVVRAARGYGADHGVIQAQWEALPDFVSNGSAILPMCDVSGSMDTHKVGGSITAMDVSLSLGVYIAERQQGAFKDLVLTFSSEPSFHKLSGSDVLNRIRNLERADWQMSTNIEKAFDLVLKTAVNNNVPAEHMPRYLVVLSDMEFDACTTGETNFTAARSRFERAGYVLPRIVFWNLNSRTNNVPVKAREDGTVLISGFSPAVMKSVLSCEDFNPMSMMYDVVMSERYDVPGWTV